MILEQADDEGRDRLVELQKNISHESVTDHDVARVLNDITSFDVTDEVETALRTQKPMCFYRQFVTFPGLLPNIEQPNPRILTPHHVLSEDIAQMCELDEVVGLAVNVGARIEEQTRLA